MSSMLRFSSALMLLAAGTIATPALARDGSEWDQARARLSATQNATMQRAIERWAQLAESSRFGFGDYAGFLLTYPGFPKEEQIRRYAEQALDRDSPGAAQVVSYFDRFPPLTNGGKAHYALALAAQRSGKARDVAIEAWRGGAMSDASESALTYLFQTTFTQADHDARMDALLWDGALSQAQRQIAYVSPGQRAMFMERLSLMQGSPPGSAGMPVTGDLLRDPGYVYARVKQARASGNFGSAYQLLATRPPAVKPPHDAEKWISELLRAAKGSAASVAVRIASSVDDSFAPGTDVSDQSYRIRDDYTSLMWLGGTKALWDLGQAREAAPLFYRYGAAAKTPGTRSKGFYWAGRAAAQAGDRDGANRYFELAAQYPDHFYGMLSLERLGRPIPDLHNLPTRAPTRDEREAFNAKPITAAVREVANGYRWRTSVQFFREIADQAQTEGDHILVADLAREIGRRDLAVILGQSAHSDGFGNFHTTSFPLIPNPPGTDWTMVHAITRQESQFAENALSHAGARGLMQLMPGTAREQAGKIGLSYDAAALMTDSSYNIRLGAGYFARMMDYFGGAYPLAVGAYNAGPGNVNKWLRANGDPRYGGVDIIRWIEEIPIYETKNYIQKVLENAVVYDAMNPDKASYRGPNPLSRFLGKRTPG
ncbi:MAG: lytic transglycosylase domain-containing protein [Novosphingobium sp.]|nr:lytic transglycosylase domain-containing protein [Novosphingobium sp.]